MIGPILSSGMKQRCRAAVFRIRSLGARCLTAIASPTRISQVIQYCGSALAEGKDVLALERLDAISGQAATILTNTAGARSPLVVARWWGTQP